MEILQGLETPETREKKTFKDLLKDEEILETLLDSLSPEQKLSLHRALKKKERASCKVLATQQNLSPEQIDKLIKSIDVEVLVTLINHQNLSKDHFDKCVSIFLDMIVSWELLSQDEEPHYNNDSLFSRCSLDMLKYATIRDGNDYLEFEVDYDDEESEEIFSDKWRSKTIKEFSWYLKERCF